MNGRASGFTLAEILVSILIFSVVSLAMVSILLTSTNLFRASEHARASSDEAIAALGMLEDDLKRMLPERDGGFFYTRLHTYRQDTGTELPYNQGNGDCAVAFIIQSPDATLADRTGANARLLVMYWTEIVDFGKPTEDNVLYRAVSPVAADIGMTKDLDIITAEFTPPPTNVLPENRFSPPEVVARRCLHFGAWVSSDQQPRMSFEDWSQDTSSKPLAPDPTTGLDYATKTVGNANPDPFPAAIRFTLTLSTGRYAPTGLVIDDNGTDRIRIAGLSSMPTAVGSMVRIDNEWIQYSDFSSGALIVDPAHGGMRAARRSSLPLSGTHDRGAHVLLGQTYSVARTLEH